MDSAKGDDSLARPRETFPGSRLSGIVALISLCSFGAVLAFSIFVSMPSNVLQLRDGSELKLIFASFLPQGWEFFTKPPNAAEFHVYTMDEEGVIASAMLFPNARAENMFGIGRSQRSQGPELATLGRDIDHWVDCDELSAGEDCLIEATKLPPTSVESPAPYPTVCGSVLLAETRPVPWQFRYDYSGWRLESRVTHLEVICP